MIKRFSSECVSIYLNISDYLTILSGIFLRRPGLKLFQDKFSEYLGVNYSFALGSARAGLILILEYIKACSRFKGRREVIMSSYNFFAIPLIVRACGFKPVFAAASAATANMEPEDVLSLVTDSTAAVIVTHVFGISFDTASINEILKEKDIVLMEDCAHSLGSEIRGRKTGTSGFASFYSFSLTKIITTFQGGMLATDDSDLAEFVKKNLAGFRSISLADLAKQVVFGAMAAVMTSPVVYNYLTFYIWYIISKYFKGLIAGLTVESTDNIDPDSFKVIMSDFQASIGLIEISKLKNILSSRRRNSMIISEKLTGAPYLTAVKIPPESDPNFQNHAFILSDPERVRDALLKSGIDIRESYLMNSGISSFSDSSGVCNIYFIPNHSYYSGAEIAFMCKKICKTLERISDEHSYA